MEKEREMTWDKGPWQETRLSLLLHYGWSNSTVFYSHSFILQSFLSLFHIISSNPSVAFCNCIQCKSSYKGGETFWAVLDF